MASLNYAIEQLRDEWNRVQRLLSETEEHWSGINRNYFNTEILRPIEEMMNDYLEELETIDRSVDRVNRTL
ncbi:MAG TPA: hypothetical protein DCS91_22450 [Microcoleaceae bacterium UBA11344]|jgi:hypothetical protein|nr:hypothetical protein [Microcoleaceae cyanobacterium UBA11344]